MCKRLFDIFAAGTSLLLFWPVFLLIAVLIKMDSRGPVFYRQWRVGRGGRPFRMWKFRKMREDLPAQGRMITSRFDLRLTGMGRFLERTKLDELPQLINILVGDMSVVGPRPEVSKFVEHYPDRWRTVLSVKPGVFGLNQLRGARNESELYPADCADLEAYYVEHILPAKLDLDRQYVEMQSRRSGLLVDLWLLLGCAWSVLAGTITWRTLIARRWQAWNLVADAAMVVLAVYAAWHIRLTEIDVVRGGATWHFRELLILAVVVRPIMFVVFGVTKGFVRSFTLGDVQQIFKAVVAGTAVIAPIYAWVINPFTSRGLLILEPAILFCLLVGSRYIGHRIYIVYVRRVGYQGQHRLASAIETLSAAALAAVSIALAREVLFGQGLSRSAYRPEVAADLQDIMLCMVAARLLSAFLFPFGTLSNALRPGRKLPRSLWLAAQGGVTGMCAAVLLNVRTGKAGFGLSATDLANLAMLDAAIFAVLMAGASLAVDALWRREKGSSQPVRLLIVGISDELIGFLAAVNTYLGEHYEIVGVVEAQSGGSRYRSHRVANCEIIGTFSDLEDIFSFCRINVVICLKGELGDEQFDEVCRLATEHDARVRVLDNIHNFILGQPGRDHDAAHEGPVSKPRPRYLPQSQSR